jgi:hypothetical protein
VVSETEPVNKSSTRAGNEKAAGDPRTGQRDRRLSGNRDRCLGVRTEWDEAVLKNQREILGGAPGEIEDQRYEENKQQPELVRTKNGEKNRYCIQHLLTVPKAEMKNTSDLSQNEIRKGKNNSTHEMQKIDFSIEK